MAELTPHRRLLILRVALALVAAGLLLALWRWTPVAAYLDPATLGERAEHLRGTVRAPLLVVAVYLVGGVLVFPVTVLVLATAVAFGPWWGSAYSLAGALASAASTYLLGAAVGREAVRRLTGERLRRASERLASRGVLSIALLRLVPLAPFTVANMVVGASHVSLREFLLGTLIGMGPGIVVLSVFGRQLREVLAEPTPTSVAALVAVLAGIVGLALAVDRWLGSKVRQVQEGGKEAS